LNANVVHQRMQLIGKLLGLAARERGSLQPSPARSCAQTRVDVAICG
jgi:hypothetical protein